MTQIDGDAYAAVKSNAHLKLQKRLREAEAAFPINMNARNGAGLTLLHVGAVRPASLFSCSSGACCFAKWGAG
jgi:hypothetical protein